MPSKLLAATAARTTGRSLVSNIIKSVHSGMTGTYRAWALYAAVCNNQVCRSTVLMICRCLAQNMHGRWLLQSTSMPMGPSLSWTGQISFWKPCRSATAKGPPRCMAVTPLMLRCLFSNVLVCRVLGACCTIDMRPTTQPERWWHLWGTNTLSSLPLTRSEYGFVTGAPFSFTEGVASELLTCRHYAQRQHAM